MIASVILAHPYPQSFNHAIFKTIIETFNENNVRVYAHDLYEENFNPVLTRHELGSDKSNDSLVNQYARELVESDILVYIHPNWWGSPPQSLKDTLIELFALLMPMIFRKTIPEADCQLKS